MTAGGLPAAVRKRVGLARTPPQGGVFLSEQQPAQREAEQDAVEGEHGIGQNDGGAGGLGGHKG